MQTHTGACMKTHGWVCILTFYIMRFYQAAGPRSHNTASEWGASVNSTLTAFTLCDISCLRDFTAFFFAVAEDVTKAFSNTVSVRLNVCVFMFEFVDYRFLFLQMANSKAPDGEVFSGWNGVISSETLLAFRQSDYCSSISVEVNLIALVLRDIQQWIILLRCVSVAAQSHTRKSCLQFCYLNCKG